MILIVFYHSILFWNGNWFTKNPVYSSNILVYIAEWLNSFHIYGFTIVSGYIFYYLKYEKGKYIRFITFIKGEAKQLLISYIFVTFLCYFNFQYFFKLWMEEYNYVKK